MLVSPVGCVVTDPSGGPCCGDHTDKGMKLLSQAHSLEGAVKAFCRTVTKSFKGVVLEIFWLCDIHVCIYRVKFTMALDKN